MYLNLTLRNARRSLKDYLIYTITLTVLTSIICLSNIVSAVSDQTGIEGSSLPILIVLIAVAMLHYTNQFFLKQRAKELATYSLLGMNKNQIALLVSVELFWLGMICFVLGSFLGIVLFGIVTLLAESTLSLTVPLFKILIQNLACFFLIELFSASLLGRRIRRLSLSQLIDMKSLQERKERRSFNFWKNSLLIGTLITMSMGGLILWDFNTFGYLLTSTLSVPLIFTLYCFYKTVFIALQAYRQPENAELYINNRLLHISKFLSSHRSNALLYTILSLCLLFAFVSLAFANTLKTGLLPNFELSEYMIFLQRVLCFIFTFLYFCLLSLLQIVDSYETRNHFRILHYLGKDQATLKQFALTDLLARFFLPIVPFASISGLLLIGVAAGNFSNIFIQTLWSSAGIYAVILLILGSVFSHVTYQLNNRTIEEAIRP